MEMRERLLCLLGPIVLYCIEFIVFCFALRLYKFYNDKKIIQGGQNRNSVYSLLSNASHSCSAAMSRSQWGRNYLRSGAGAGTEIIFLINI